MKSALLFLCLLLATARAAIISGTIPEKNRLFFLGQRPFDFDGDGFTDLTFAGSDPCLGFLRVIPGYAGFSSPGTDFIAEAKIVRQLRDKGTGPDRPGLRLSPLACIRFRRCRFASAMNGDTGTVQFYKRCCSEGCNDGGQMDAE